MAIANGKKIEPITMPEECPICTEQPTELRGHPHPTRPEQIIDKICRPCFAKIYAQAQIDHEEFYCPLCKIPFTEKGNVFPKAPSVIQEWLWPLESFLLLLQEDIRKELNKSSRHAIKICYIKTCDMFFTLFTVCYETNWLLIAEQQELDAFIVTCRKSLRASLPELYQLLKEAAPNLLAGRTWPSIELP